MATAGHADASGAPADKPSAHKEKLVSISDIEIREVAFDAPWSWLAAAWRDIMANPVVSLGYGAVFTAISLILFYGITHVGWQSIVMVLGGGFLILGPMFAVGLYEASRRRQEGEPVTIGSVALVATRSPGQLAVMGFTLAFLFMVWVRVAFVLFAIFFGPVDLPAAEDFIPELLFTPHGLGMLITGTIVGAILAFTAFAISTISVPLMMRHRTDIFTAMMTSVRAVSENHRPMLLWAALIAGIMFCGIATFFIGLIVAFPLVGHATWHAYKANVKVVADGGAGAAR